MGTKPVYNSEQELRDDFGGSMIDLSNYNKVKFPTKTQITIKIAKYRKISEQEFLNKNDIPNRDKFKPFILLKDDENGVVFFEKLYGPTIYSISIIANVKSLKAIINIVIR